MIVKLLVVEDHPLVAEGLKTMLSLVEDFQVVATVDSGRAALDWVVSGGVDVVLMDIMLGPKPSGLDAMKVIKERAPGTRVLILTMYEDIQSATVALRAGADGYLTKTVPRDVLVHGIHDVLQGRPVIDPGVATRLLRQQFSTRDNALSDRELMILQEVSQGKTTRTIARTLGLSEDTIKSHLKRTYRKLNVSDRAEAVAEGLRKRLIH